MKLTDIKVNQNYIEVRRSILKDENVTVGELPSFMATKYVCAENIETKEKVYILRDYKSGIITDIQTDINKIYNQEVAENNIKEVLKNN